MSDKSIILKQGGKHGFAVTKQIIEDDAARYSVSVGMDGFGTNPRWIANVQPYAEAMEALNRFREEADDAFYALQALATLTTTGTQATAS